MGKGIKGYLKCTLSSPAPSALETVVEWVKESRTVCQRLGLQGVGRGIGKWD